MATVDVYSMDKKKVGSVELDDAIFGAEVKPHLLHAAVRYQLAKRRQGTHAVKRRADVTGGGKKPYKQKGTGRARQGTTRAPQWRGGGVVFGPEPRDHAIGMNKKERRAALCSALSKRVADNALVVLDTLSFDAPKTKQVVDLLQRFEMGSALLVLPEGDDAVEKSARNLPNVTVIRSGGVNVYDILRRDNLVITQDAVEALTKRLAG
ncbi:MAG: 50S ribosomal protein L4 [Alphaproteobacteria bacterium]|nr:50S ribosomal protein L4 [Alphaproteobacteria bacterium]